MPPRMLHMTTISGSTVPPNEVRLLGSSLHRGGGGGGGGESKLHQFTVPAFAGLGLRLPAWQCLDWSDFIAQYMMRLYCAS